MGCILLRGFLTASSPLDAKGQGIGMVHRRGNAQPMSPLKQGEITKMDEGKGDHVALSHTKTWKKPFEPPSPNCPSCLVWHRSGLAWLALTQMSPRRALGVIMGQGPFPLVILNVAILF